MRDPTRDPLNHGGTETRRATEKYLDEREVGAAVTFARRSPLQFQDFSVALRVSVPPWFKGYLPAAASEGFQVALVIGGGI